MAKIQLTIPEPCHENWNNMTPVDKGRFCNSCQKQVVDFSTMSDREIAQFFKKPSGSVCGRFMQDQLERDLVVPKKRLPWLKYFFQFVLPAFLTTTKVAAQGAVKIVKGDTLTLSASVCNKNTDREVKGEVRGQVIQRDNNMLRGVVTDDKGEPISYCTVEIKGTRQGTVTGKQGEFSLPVPDTSQMQTLVFSCLGFETREYTVTKQDFLSIQKILLIRLQTQLMGDVVIVAGYTVKKGKPKDKTIPLIHMAQDTTSKYFKLFPNPVQPGADLTIQWQKQEEGYYVIELINSGGQPVFNKEIWMDAEARLLNLDIPAVVAGNYFVRIVSKKTSKNFTEKLIIE